MINISYKTMPNLNDSFHIYFWELDFGPSVEVQGCLMCALTRCVQWAACCVWELLWSGRRGKVCWSRQEGAVRNQWWTATNVPILPVWRMTPLPRTISLPKQQNNELTVTLSSPAVISQHIIVKSNTFQYQVIIYKNHKYVQ